MAFTDRVVFVAGGCGIVGSGIALAFLAEGAKVAVNSRSSERLGEFKKKIPIDAQNRIILINDDVSDERGAVRIRDKLIKEHGGVHHVVSSVGSLFRGGSLTTQSLSEFNNQIKNLASGHFLVAKAFMPYLTGVPGSTYTFICGSSGEVCFSKDISLTTVGAACVFGMSLAAQAEFDGNSNLAINELRLGMWINDKPDTSFDGAQNQAGNDLIGQLVVSLNKAKKRGTFKVFGRTAAQELTATCQNRCH